MISQNIKSDFPVYKQNSGLIYLDSTATALKPTAVLDKVNDYYRNFSANVFRGIYKISEKATAEYEKARADIAKLIGAKTADEIIFTRNTSESLNLVYYSFVIPNFKKDSQIVTSIIEHHSNFVPWQIWANGKDSRLKIWYPKKDGILEINDLIPLVGSNTKMIAITATSNVLGTNVNIKDLVTSVKRINPQVVVLVDAAQTVPHMKVDVSDWGADLVAFSGHKMMGPTGIGVLWGKMEILEKFQPFMYGGDMISEVHEHKTIFNRIPHRFEAGTPHIAGAIGLGAAACYLMDLGMDNVRNHEEKLVGYALSQLSKLPYVEVYGPKKAELKGGVMAFNLKNIHPHDVAQILDQENIAIRVGYHCAQPLHEYLNIGPSARASFYIYNTEADIDALVTGIAKVFKTLT